MKVQRLSYVWWVREADSLYTTLPLPAALADPIFSFALISAASLRSPGNVYLSFVSEDRLCLRSPLFPEVFPPAFPRSQPQSWISPARISLLPRNHLPLLRAAPGRCNLAHPPEQFSSLERSEEEVAKKQLAAMQTWGRRRGTCPCVLSCCPPNPN